MNTVQLPAWMTGASAPGTSSAHIIDLAHPLTNATPIYPGDPQPHIFTATTVEREGYNLSHVHIGTQTGTHIDAPFHFRDEGATIDRMPLAMMVGPAVIIDARGAGELGRIDAAELAPYRERLRPGVIALFVTGWYRHAGSELFFRHPYLTAAAAHVLLESGVRTLAIDTLNADRTGGDEFPVHEMYADAGGLIAENLAGTDQLALEGEPFLVLLPLNLIGCDGAPVRAVALEPA
jgi:kynurenine formamidase